MAARKPENGLRPERGEIEQRGFLNHVGVGALAESVDKGKSLFFEAWQFLDRFFGHIPGIGVLLAVIVAYRGG